jgi:hypothetical protein
LPQTPHETVEWQIPLPRQNKRIVVESTTGKVSFSGGEQLPNPAMFDEHGKL